MSCEICGREIYGRGIKIVVEGATMTVCKECADLGERVREEHHEGNIMRKASNRPRQPMAEKNDRPATKPKQPPSKRDATYQNADAEELVENYAEVIKKARGTMSQEEFAASLSEKASVIHKIEMGKLRPTMKLAKRIEKRYRVKLINYKKEAEDIDDIVLKSDDKKDYSATLGDFIKNQK
ncbi:MAG TPA: multiprotein bridging factor aMBF1 [Candidatus Lokiarchaeia archaeon]|nr:multiprotein bridging factor aMBF1 [Candidatus Lokiarchaeia archaeon]